MLVGNRNGAAGARARARPPPRPSSALPQQRSNLDANRVPTSSVDELTDPASRRRSLRTGRASRKHIPPGTPSNDGFIDSFNRRLCKERSDRIHWTSLLEAVVIGDFKVYHNRAHRNSALGYRRPSTLRPGLTPTTRWRAASTDSVRISPGLDYEIVSSSETGQKPCGQRTFCTQLVTQNGFVSQIVGAAALKYVAGQTHTGRPPKCQQ
ncbi:integrase core domain-containing protein [Nocardia sp. NPDC049526]|uniref:integrase core domain-containing protein n=1 Tax=Nocardia sp. NPDC049526 TaxID=3364316 RepID=UPI00379E316E